MSSALKRCSKWPRHGPVRFSPTLLSNDVLVPFGSPGILQETCRQKRGPSNRLACVSLCDDVEHRCEVEKNCVWQQIVTSPKAAYFSIGGINMYKPLPNGWFIIDLPMLPQMKCFSGMYTQHSRILRGFFHASCPWKSIFGTDAPTGPWTYAKGHKRILGCSSIEPECGFHSVFLQVFCWQSKQKRMHVYICCAWTACRYVWTYAPSRSQNAHTYDFFTAHHPCLTPAIVNWIKLTYVTSQWHPSPLLKAESMITWGLP